MAPQQQREFQLPESLQPGAELPNGNPLAQLKREIQSGQTPSVPPQVAGVPQPPQGYQGVPQQPPAQQQQFGSSFPEHLAQPQPTAAGGMQGAPGSFPFGPAPSQPAQPQSAWQPPNPVAPTAQPAPVHAPSQAAQPAPPQMPGQQQQPAVAPVAQSTPQPVTPGAQPAPTGGQSTEQQQLDAALARPAATDPTLSPEEARQLRALRPYVADYAQNLREYEEWKASRQSPDQQAQQQAAHQQAHQEAKRRVPDFDESMLEMVRRDENGNLVPVNEFINPTVVPQVESYLKWYQNEQQRIVRDPLAVLEEAGLQDRFLKPLQDRITQLENQITEEKHQAAWSAARQEVLGELSRWVQHDQYGRPLYNQQTGDYLYTPDGQLYRWAESQMPENTDPATRHQMAKNYVDMAKGMYGQQQQAAQANQPPAPQQFQAPQPGYPQAAASADPRFTDRVPPRGAHDGAHLVDDQGNSRISDRFAAVMRGETPYPGMQ